MDINEIVEEVKSLVLQMIQEAGFEDSEFEFVDICAYGSRVSGKASIDSDLDILVEYKGSAREDHIFNILHEEELQIDGMIVDINPIKEDCSGTMEEYLNRCDDNWKEHMNRRRCSR